MRTNVVLIDFESVQPESLRLFVDQEHFKVLVFVGANQTKLPFEIVSTLQKLGERAEYIKISGNGPNALDFHIAYYIGTIAARDSSAYFHIISKDKGFDPLIAHLKSKKIFAGRVNDIQEIPLIKVTSKISLSERISLVSDRLLQPNTTKPRSRKTLASAISGIFQKQISDEDIEAVIDGLLKSGGIIINGSKIKYASEVV